MNPITRTIVIGALVALLIAAALLYAEHYKVMTAELQNKADDYRAQLTASERQLVGQSKVLSAYREQSQKNAELAAQQQAIVASLAGEASVRRQHLRQLESENEQIKRWADTMLPDDIARMRVRPAIAGAKAYHQWLSEGNPVRAAGQQSGEQR